MDFSSITKILYNLVSYIPTIFVGTDYEKYVKYWPIFILGMVTSLILTPIIGYIANKYDITYVPQKGRKDNDNPEKALHRGITPSLGGLAITIPVVITILILFQLDSFTIPVLISLLILIIGATLDDIFNLPAKAQITYQAIAALIIATSILDLSSIPFFNFDLNLLTYNYSLLGLEQSISLPGDIILFIWLLVCLNAVKWTAGSPGIIESNSFIIFSLIFIISVRYASTFSSTLSILIAGSLFIFLIFAFPPQKIMTGSAGKSVYGFLICILALIADAKISTTIMLLILPLIDFIYVITKRYLTYRPKNLMKLMSLNGPDHLHHQLLKLDLSRKQIVLIEMSATLFLGSFAILATGALKYFALIIITALSIAFIVYINIKASQPRDKEEKKESPESKYSY